MQGIHFLAYLARLLADRLCFRFGAPMSSLAPGLTVGLDMGVAILSMK